MKKENVVSIPARTIKKRISLSLRRLCRKGKMRINVMLNLFQHLIKSNAYETLKRVQGDNKEL